MGGELGRANCEHALLPFHSEPRCCEKWLPVMGGEGVLPVQRLNERRKLAASLKLR